MRTTPEAIDLQRTFREMLDGGDRACAMEISSHALELRRADGIHVAAAIFTNLTQDHLDFHPTMEDYFQAKRRLFAIAAHRRADRQRRRSLRPPPRRRVSRVRDVRDRLGGDYRAIERAHGLRGQRQYVRHARTASSRCTCRCPGASTSRTRSARGPPRGRSGAERRRPAGDRARARTLRARRRGPAVRRARRLRAHAGLAGERPARRARARRRPRDRRVRRGRGPRPRQAAADGGDRRAARRRLPRHLRQPALGGSGGDHRRDPRRHRPVRRTSRADPDRRASIHRAIALAEPGDVVVIAGKGHEQGQEFAGGRKEPFDDVTVAREALRSVAPA